MIPHFFLKRSPASALALALAASVLALSGCKSKDTGDKAPPPAKVTTTKAMITPKSNPEILSFFMACP